MPPKYTIEKWNQIADELCSKYNLIRLEDCNGIRDKFKSITKEGYLVYPNIKSLKRNRQPLIFFKDNPNTIYNIKLWIIINNKNLELISEEYESGQKELRWICKNNKCKKYNKEFLKCWSTVKQGHACNDCGLNKMKETKQNKCPPEKKSLFDIYPEICDKYWDYDRNNKTSKQYYPRSNQSIYWKCNECGYYLPNKLSINNVVSHGLSCPRCSDGISYPEKFMFNVLSQLNIKFKKSKIFNWSKNIKHKNKKLCGNKLYDFWIEIINCIIETHGNHHYKQSKWKGEKAKTLKEEQQNDKIKEQLAISNNIKNYIVIDCRKSNLEYIKNSILTSKLSDLFNLNQIDWEEVHKNSLKSKIKEVCDLWNQDIKNFNEIKNITGLGIWAIIDYLKKGNEIGWCQYITGEGLKRGHPNFKERKPIIQFSKKGEYIKRYESITESSMILNLCIENISAVCNGRKKSAGGFIFILENDYIKNPEIIKNKCEEIKKSKNINYLLTGLTYIGDSPTGEEYEFINQTQFAKEHNLDSDSVNKCLLGRLKSHRKWKFRIKE